MITFCVFNFKLQMNKRAIIKQDVDIKKSHIEKTCPNTDI